MSKIVKRKRMLGAPLTIVANVPQNGATLKRLKVVRSKSQFIEIRTICFISQFVRN